jgi:hypothetical protein
MDLVFGACLCAATADLASSPSIVSKIEMMSSQRSSMVFSVSPRYPLM